MEQKFENSITFMDATMEEILRLDQKGMTYKGQFIEDAGEAHKAFMETMHYLKNRYPQEIDDGADY